MAGGQARRGSPTDSQDQTTPPPSYKRRRIGLACTSCRNRKSRCNGARPACSLCVELGFDCFYEQPGTAGSAHLAPPVPSNIYDDRLRSIEDTLKLLVQSAQLPQS